MQKAKKEKRRKKAAPPVEAIESGDVMVWMAGGGANETSISLRVLVRRKAQTKVIVNNPKPKNELKATLDRISTKIRASSCDLIGRDGKQLDASLTNAEGWAMAAYLLVTTAIRDGQNDAKKEDAEGDSSERKTAIATTRHRFAITRNPPRIADVWVSECPIEGCRLVPIVKFMDNGDGAVPRPRAWGAAGLHGLPPATKTGASAWGQGTFVRASSWGILGKRTIPLREVWKEDPDLRKVVESDDMILETIVRATSVANCLTIAPATRRKAKEGAIQERLSNEGKETDSLVYIVNTHLYSHPSAPHIRSLQLSILCKSLKRIWEAEGREDAAPSLVICGDMNATYDEGAVSLMMTGKLGANHHEWAEGASFVNVRTKKEREEKWKTSLSCMEKGPIRRAFSALDAQRTGRIDLSKLLERLSTPSQQEGEGGSFIEAPNIQRRGKTGNLLWCEPESRVFTIFTRHINLSSASRTSPLSLLTFSGLKALRAESQSKFTAFIELILAHLRINEEAGRGGEGEEEKQKRAIGNNKLPITDADTRDYVAVELETGFDLHSAFKEGDLPCTFLAGDPITPSVLDFIFYGGRRLSLTGTFPPIDTKDLRAGGGGGIPSRFMPSDHLSIVANFRQKLVSSAEAEDKGGGSKITIRHCQKYILAHVGCRARQGKDKHETAQQLLHI
eukprot:jgi/Bigna1/79192/fgenesh1_pg.60_\